MAQRSLFQLGFGGKRKLDDVIDLPSKNPKLTTCAESKHVRKFRKEWLKEFEWLETKEIDGRTFLFCTWCQEAKTSNAFATTGSNNLQKSALDRHANKNPDHLKLASARILVQNKKTVKDVIEINEARQSSDSIEQFKSKEAQIRTAYFVVKNNLPQTNHNKLIELQVENGCTALQNEKMIYKSHQVHDEMIDVINDHIHDLIRQDIINSEFVGIIIDETTDITVHKKLNIYFKCLKYNSSEPIVHFINCVSVINGKATTIVEVIKEECRNLGLDMSHVISMASDGASVMTGRKGGVGALLKKDNPRLVQVHCVAHRLALCAGQACKESSSFSEYHNTVKNVYRYFHNSAVRYNQLREMENVLNDSSGDTHITLKEPASFRWLSLESAVQAIYKVYPALVMVLESEAAAGSADAKGFLKSVKSVGFILRTCFLIDVLACVNKLCKVFQKDDLNIDTVLINLNSTIDTLNALKNKNGSHLEQAYELIVNGKYSDVKIVDTPQIRMGFQSSSTQYLDNLIDNLNNRFDEKSMEKLCVLNSVLNPGKLPTVSSDIYDYGLEDLNKVIEWFGPCENDKGLIDPSRIKDDYLQFKMILKNFRGQSLSKVCQTLITEFNELYPDFVVLAKFMVIAPLTSVACERGFSTQNRLKTKARSSIKDDKLSKFIRIMEESDKVMKTFPGEELVDRFNKKIKRRK